MSKSPKQSGNAARHENKEEVASASDGFIYLDYNATTPIIDEVSSTMIPFLTRHYGNPYSSYAIGLYNKHAVQHARNQVASLLNCDSKDIIFTSGGSESNNYAIKGYGRQHKRYGKHMITSLIEHPAVACVMQFLADEEGFEISYVNVDSNGTVDVKEIEQAIRDDTILISIMHSNNEVGTIQPIKQIDAILRKLGRRKQIALHTDASQSVGKVPIDVDDLGVDLLTVAGHKLYAPKGIGALYVREGIELQKLIHGAAHENNMRAGTESTVLIPGLGKACEVAKRDMKSNMAHMQEMRDKLHELLLDGVPTAKLNGHPTHRLPNTLSIGFPDIEAHKLIAMIQDRVAVSAGAACKSGHVTISPVLNAMQVPIHTAKGTIRFSTGRYTTSSDVEKAAAIVIDAVEKLRSEEDEQRAKNEGNDDAALSPRKKKKRHPTSIAAQLPKRNKSNDAENPEEAGDDNE